MEKLGQLAATGDVGPDRRRHPAVAVGAGLPRRPAAHVQVPRRPDDPAARPARRAAASCEDRRRRVHAVREGRLDDPRRADAGRRVGVRAGVRHDVRRVPGARRGHLRSCCARRAPRSSSSPRRSRTRCARPPTSSTGCRPRTCRWPGWCSTAPTRCSPISRPPGPAAAAEELRGAPLAAAVLRLHADRVDLAEREERLLARFTGAHPAVPVTQGAGGGGRHRRPRRPARDRRAAWPARAVRRRRPSRSGELTLPAVIAPRAAVKRHAARG